MLRLLRCREHGIHSPATVIKAEITRRALSLDVSKYFDMQKVFDAGINSLDIDGVENRYLLAGAADGVIVVYDLHNLSDQPKYTFPMVCTAGRSNRYRHKKSIETVQWFPIDTGMFLSSATDKILKVWDTNALKTADEFEFSSIIYCHHMSQISTQHSLVAVACQSSKIRLIDLKSGSSTHVLRGHNQAVYCCQWSPRHEFIVASGSADSKVMLWDIRRARSCLMMLDQYNGDTKAGPNSVKTAHDGLVNGMCFTEDGTQLLTTGTDHRIHIWDTMSGTNLMVNFGKIVNNSHKCIELSVSRGTSPTLVYIPSNSVIQVFDTSSGQKVATLRGHYNQVNSCVYHPTEQFLYSCGNDRNILVWTPQTSTLEAYEQHLTEQSKPKEKIKSFSSRVATADAWSSDED